LPEDLETLARVTMPTLVFGHRLDPLHVLDDARDLVRALPDGRLVELPWIGARALEPAKIADAMGPFLDDLRLRR
jgi:pimeloyl-ACP methyl ester carboxylesterase